MSAHEPGIITCSNLRRAYRQITIGTRQGVRLVFLKNDEQVIHARIVQRQHRYMPSTLLRSQFETLEEPSEDEHPVVVTVRGSIAETVAKLLRLLRRGAHPVGRAAITARISSARSSEL